MTGGIVIPTWMCAACGYVMNRAAPADRAWNRSPGESDILMCAGCGKLYTIRSGERVAITPEDIASMSPEEQEELAVAELARIAAFGRRVRMKRGKPNG
jgi:hypothetical protein